MSNIMCNKIDVLSTNAYSIRLLDSMIRKWITLAIKNDSDRMIEMLRHYPDLAKQIEPISGFTALHWAAKHGNLEMVKVLARNGRVDVNQKSRGGYTALHLAQQYGHTNMVYQLVGQFGAETHLRDNYGNKPHQYAKKPKCHRLLFRNPSFSSSFNLY